jgi:imidazolonepropionase-like amidohydrolase
MKGDEIIDKADIVITNNRITAIGNQGEVKIPVGVKILDITGKVVLPGFIDVHAHWSTRPELWEPESTSSYSNLAFGITTIRDPQSNPDLFGYADWASTGEVPSPRIFSTGPAIGESHNIQSLEEARKIVHIYHDNYKTSYLKIYLPGTRQQRQWLVQACRELNMMPTTEAGGDAKEVITHFLDGSAGNEHTLSTQPMYQDLVQLFSKAGTTYTPTLLVAFGAALPIYRVLAEERPYDNPKIQYFFSEDLFLSSAKRILWFADEDMNYKEAASGTNAMLKAGGRVALGGHGEMQGLSNHWEMKLMNDGGMLPHDILKVATRFGAETLGLEKELGSLEVSKLADLVILDKDPLENIRNTTTIKYVMKNGKLYDGDNLDEVWPEEKRLPEMWWHLKK